MIERWPSPHDEIKRRWAAVGFGPVMLEPVPRDALAAYNKDRDRRTDLPPWEPLIAYLKCNPQLPMTIKGVKFECEALRDIWVHDVKFQKNSILMNNNPVPARSLLETPELMDWGSELLQVGMWIHISVVNMGLEEVMFGGLFYGTLVQ